MKRLLLLFAIPYDFVAHPYVVAGFSPRSLGTIMAATLSTPTKGRQPMTCSRQKITRWPGRAILAAIGIAVAGLISGALTAAQTPSPDKPPLAEEVFKNVQALKG